MMKDEFVIVRLGYSSILGFAIFPMVTDYYL